MLGAMDWPGVESRESREALLQDLAAAVDSWRSAVNDALNGSADTDPEMVDVLANLDLSPTDVSSIVAVVEWALSGLVHSALVTLDGGSASCPTLELRDPHGNALGDALHEQWPEFDPREREWFDQHPPGMP